MDDRSDLNFIKLIQIKGYKGYSVCSILFKYIFNTNLMLKSKH